MLLYTLRDLYSNFIDDYSEYDNLPKFSFFASLKPEEVFSPVIQEHMKFVFAQNMKMLS